jgi:hypothetical protein
MRLSRKSLAIFRKLGLDTQFDQDLDDAIRGVLMPWLLSNQDVIVTLNRDSVLRSGGSVQTMTQSKFVFRRSLTPNESSRPHSEVVSPDGLTIGTLFAEDAISKIRRRQAGL